jgi:hypothetical protein
MNISLLGDWYAVGEITVPRLMAQESAALIMLAASLLVFRTFRERYLLMWILGWLACFVSRWTLRGSDAETIPRYLTAISQAEFILAICLFAAAVFIYTHARRLLPPLLLISLAVIGFAVARALLWPDSITLRAALEVSYRVIAFSAAFQLIRFRWARWEIGPWLLSVSLLLLHLRWDPVSLHFPPGFALLRASCWG